MVARTQVLPANSASSSSTGASVPHISAPRGRAIGQAVLTRVAGVQASPWEPEQRQGWPRSAGRRFQGTQASSCCLPEVRPGAPTPLCPPAAAAPQKLSLGAVRSPRAASHAVANTGRQKPGNLLGRSEQVRRPGGWAWHGGDAADAQPPPPWRAAGGQAGGQGRAKPQHSRPPGGGRKGPSLGVAPLQCPRPPREGQNQRLQLALASSAEGIGRAGAAPDNPSRTLDSLLHPSWGNALVPLHPLVKVG